MSIIAENWELIRKVITEVEWTDWDSLIINKRKPFTRRMWFYLPDPMQHLRVCLHEFLPCRLDEAFAHPHGWPAEFAVMSGAYREDLWFSDKTVDVADCPPVSSVYTQGSWHVIERPNVWHRVQPLEITYTVMVNGLPFENPLPDVRSTKGKDLEEMTEDDKLEFLELFAALTSGFERKYLPYLKK